MKCVVDLVENLQDEEEEDDVYCIKGTWNLFKANTRSYYAYEIGWDGYWLREWSRDAVGTESVVDRY